MNEQPDEGVGLEWALNQINKHYTKDVITNANFFIDEATKAFEEMVNFAGEPLTKENTEAFNKARDKFWLLAARAKREHARL